MVLMPGCGCCQTCDVLLPSSIEVTISSAPSQYFTIGSDNAAYLPSHNGTYSLSKTSYGYQYGFTENHSIEIWFDQIDQYHSGGIRYWDWMLTVRRLLRVSYNNWNAAGPNNPISETDMAASDWISRIVNLGGGGGYALRGTDVTAYDSCNISTPQRYRWLYVPSNLEAGNVFYGRNHVRDVSASFASCSLPLSVSYRLWLGLAALQFNFQTAHAFPFTKQDRITNGDYDPSAPLTDFVGLDSPYSVTQVRAIYSDGSTRELWNDIGQTTCTPI